MGGHWTKHFSFVTGVVRYKDLAYITIVDDQLDPYTHPHAGIIEWDRGQWNDGGRVAWPVVAMSVCKAPREQMIMIGPHGEVKLMGSGDTHEENICVREGSPENRGQLRSVRGVSDKAYAVGMNRTVYRRDDVNSWVTMEEGLPQGNSMVSGFEAIDGHSATELYAVGRDGEIWRYDGSLWRQKASPTNMILTDVCCAQDGYVYACGRNGTLIRGVDDTWSTFDQSLTNDDFWSIRSFQGHIYVSTFRGVLVVREGELLPVDMGDDQPTSSYHLSEADGVLWSVGKKDIMAHDGDRWTRID